MDLTSESHYKEYGLFTYIEARKLNQRSKAVQNGMKKLSNHSHTVGVAVQSCVWFENLQTSLYPLFFFVSNCVNGSVTTDNTEGLYFQTKEKFEAWLK